MLKTTLSKSLAYPYQLLIFSTFTTHIKTRITKSIALQKKKDKAMIELKKQLAKKQPIKSTDLYDEYHYRDVYKRINIELEAFFYQRPYTLDNFNFLLNLIAEQQPSDYLQKIDEVIQKMNMLGMYPNEKSYNYMIKAAGNASDPKKAEIFFQEACERFLPNKYFYTSLLQTYVKNNDPYMGLKLLDEMQEKGIEPDLPVYTTLVNCFRKGRKLEKCWEIHRKLMKSKQELDETYTGVMLKVYAATHDAQKALKLYRQNIEEKNIKPMIQTTNSLLKALSSRRQYSNYVVDKVISIAEAGQIVTTETFDWALRACSVNGNIKSAGELLKMMRLKNIEIKKSTFNILLKVYSKACSIPEQDENIREVIIADSWKLLQEMRKKNMVETNTLNHMLTVYANSLNSQQIDGLVLPLYQKFNKPYNIYTYQVLMNLYYKMNDFNKAIRIWNQMDKKIKENREKLLSKYGAEQKYFEEIEKNNQELRPTFICLHEYLEIGIKTMDMNIVLDALNRFKEMKRLPKNAILKMLGNLKNLPEEIQTSLMDFQIQFGQAKISKKKRSQPVQDPQNR